MIVEMHCHTAEHSPCSHVAAVDLVRRLCEAGVQTVVLTDHHYQWSEEELADLRRRAQLPEVCRILAGQEIETYDFGHLLIYGAQATIPAMRLSLLQIREQYPDAAIVWAHPYRDKAIPDPDRLQDPAIDAVEIVNSNYSVLETARALKDWHTYRFTAAAGTDTHALSYAGVYPTVFDHPFDSIEGMAEEIAAGRCRPYYKEIPQPSGTSSTRVTEVTIGAEETGAARKIIVKTFDDVKAWTAGERSHHIAEELRRQGFDRGTCRVPKPLDEDPESLSLIEERVGGQSLFDAMVQARPAQAIRYLELAARWLSKLHNGRFRITPTDEYLRIEPGRLEHYLKSLMETRNRYLGRVREIKEQVLEQEIELLGTRPEILVQGHGDFHPKNIFIGRDTPEGGEYVTAIDFGSSYQLPRAFDVGTFLAQYISMFFRVPQVQRHAPADIFLRTYLDRTDDLEEGFPAHVNLFKARTCLSILYFLAKVRMGETEEFWRILVEAERSLAAMAAGRGAAVDKRARRR
jgi:predicted metal-dependent phosphoesterase TrpH/aminoglycoside/choline kinase family phosphotransferase